MALTPSFFKSIAKHFVIMFTEHFELWYPYIEPDPLSEIEPIKDDMIKILDPLISLPALHKPCVILTGPGGCMLACGRACTRVAVCVCVCVWGGGSEKDPPPLSLFFSLARALSLLLLSRSQKNIV